MSKKITITEQDVDEPYDEIIEQVDNTPPPEPDPTQPPPQPEKQKADFKMRMRELYKCDDCGKYLTKKSLNYSHYKTCRGKPETKLNQSQNHKRHRQSHKRHRRNQCNK